MSEQTRDRLSSAQRDMLTRIAASQYGQHCVFPRGRRTAAVLIRKGLLKNIGQQWHAITPAGRALIERLKAPGGQR